MRTLAIVGLFAVLALIAWLVVQGVRSVGSGSLSAYVSGVTSLFSPAPEERIVFELDTRTFTAGEAIQIQWLHDGATENPEYTFSYNCNRGVVLEVQEEETIRTITCGEAYGTSKTQLTIIPRSPESRFADIELRIEHGTVYDSTIVTIVNTAIALNTTVPLADMADVATSTTADEAPKEHSVPVVTPPKPTPATPVTTKQTTPTVTKTPTPVTTAPRYVAPADLVVNIVETGLYLKVAGRDTFFPITPIPSDKRAGVVFTVTNRGEQPSGVWAFTAQLPTEDNEKFRYVSPAQQSLAPGMQVQFTLGFDTVTNEKNGVIRIEITPIQSTDIRGNNVDATIVMFK